MFWIEGTDSDGNEYSGRWGNVSNENQDAIMNFAISILGQPDTIS